MQIANTLNFHGEKENEVKSHPKNPNNCCKVETVEKDETNLVNWRKIKTRDTKKKFHLLKREENKFTFFSFYWDDKKRD
jgi:hypothetical protein